VLQVAKACPLLGTLPLTFAFPVWGQIYAGNNPQVIVFVYDDAGVSAGTLARAEQKAARIFEHAGLDVVWKNCSTSTKHVGPDALVRAGKNPPGSAYERAAGLRPAGRVGTPASTWSGFDCGRVEWPTHLAVRFVPHSASLTNEVFGAAFLSADGKGCYSDVFYNLVAGLHADWNIGLADILGNVIAHELGHLLLGSNSHSPAGIMRARWQAEELQRVAKGTLSFNAEQAEYMRGKLIAARASLVATVRASY
jgi:hypothetical protein